jgi:predicted dehydrogenase
MKKYSSSAIRLAIIGTGGMANEHVKQFKTIDDCAIVAGVDIDQKRVEEFCAKHAIPEALTSVKELLKRKDIDALSIVTPDAFHAPLSIQALKAGKHVLCEKPLALNYPDARKMVVAAKRSGKINMFNLSYRNWPAIHAVAEVVQKGGIGEVRHLEASYLQSWLTSRIWGDWKTSPTWLWRLSTRHGSKGVLGDIGVHILDFATYPTGKLSSIHCKLKTFPKAPRNRIGRYYLDANDSAVMTVELKNGALGVIHTTRFASGHANRLYLKISGNKGAVEIDSDRSTTSYRICVGPDLDKAAWKEVDAPAVPSIYQRFIASIKSGKQSQPDFARGAEIQKLMDTAFLSDLKNKTILF